MIDLAVHRSHELRPRGDMMLERVPNVRPLADAHRFRAHAGDGLFQRRYSGVKLGKLILVVLFDLICGNWEETC